MFIPNDMIEAIIGKGGVNIDEIRQDSGSVIKIDEPQANSNARLVTITSGGQSASIVYVSLKAWLEIPLCLAATRTNGLQRTKNTIPISWPPASSIPNPQTFIHTTMLVIFNNREAMKNCPSTTKESGGWVVPLLPRGDLIE
jgi:hypothetical protein